MTQIVEHLRQSIAQHPVLLIEPWLPRLEAVPVAVGLREQAAGTLDVGGRAVLMHHAEGVGRIVLQREHDLRARLRDALDQFGDLDGRLEAPGDEGFELSAGVGESQQRHAADQYHQRHQQAHAQGKRPAHPEVAQTAKRSRREPGAHHLALANAQPLPLALAYSPICTLHRCDRVAIRAPAH